MMKNRKAERLKQCYQKLSGKVSESIDLTDIGLEPYPEGKKNSIYDGIIFSDLPSIEEE